MDQTRTVSFFLREAALLRLPKQHAMFEQAKTPAQSETVTCVPGPNRRIDIDVPLRSASVDHQERRQSQRGYGSRRFDTEAEIRLRESIGRIGVFEGVARKVPRPQA